MTDIRFYHLARTSLDQVLPQLLTKALQTGQRILILTENENEAERLNDYLWTYDPASFIPHGTAKDGNETDQTVFITSAPENPASASILFTLSGHRPEKPESYQMVCDIFDGRDETALIAARARWKTYKDQGLTLTYWQQGEKGWDKKA